MLEGRHEDWPFDDPPNVVTFVIRDAFEGRTQFLQVVHDHDGEWQATDGRIAPKTEDAMLVALKEVVQRDGSLLELGDLPPGWRAWRETADCPWHREAFEESQDDQ